MKRLLLTCSLVLVATVAGAQDYRFRVPELQMEVDVREDASVAIHYRIDFVNEVGAHVIDVVDVGTPTGFRQARSIRASIDGWSVTTIRESEYVDGAFEAHLDAQSIAPGATGSFEANFEVSDLVFQDTTRSDLASLRITPTWFGPEFVQGAGRTRLAILLPAGVKPDETLHHGENFTQKALYQGRTAVIWEWPEPAIRKHLVGVSFPRAAMKRVVEISRWELLDQWMRAHAGFTMILIGLSLVLLGVLYFRFTGGTGCCLFVPLVGALGIGLLAVPAWGFLSLPALGSLVWLNEKYLRKRKGHYLPAVAEVEGGGIKRGLTAPEAAALLELPLGRVLSLVVFGMLRKGILRHESGEGKSLKVSLVPDFEVPVGEDALAWRRARAEKNGIVFHRYESAFLDRIQEDWKEPLSKIDFGVAIKGLVEGVAKRLEGFDLDETRAYYQHIVNRALREAERLGDLQARAQFLDRNLDWVMMDDGWGRVLRRSGHHYHPGWYHRTGPASTAGEATSSSRAPGGFTPSTGDVAASFAGFAENTMGSLASSLGPGTVKLAGSGGFIDLSGVDTATKSVFEALSSGSGGGGGVGGSACDCAGCACACA